MVNTRSSTLSRSSPSKAAATSTSNTSKSKPKAKPVASTSKFPYNLPYSSLDLRTHPHLYRTGIGEQGVLLVEPYKSELLPHWKFKSPSYASASAAKLYSIFISYLSEGDFVGADLARKFIQMGYTRARRYANHKGGKKYMHDGRGNRKEIARLEVKDQDADKVEAARIFKAVLDGEVWTNEEYVRLREKHVEWARGREMLTEECEDVKRALREGEGKERVVRKW